MLGWLKFTGRNSGVNGILSKNHCATRSKALLSEPSPPARRECGPASATELKLSEERPACGFSLCFSLHFWPFTTFTSCMGWTMYASARELVFLDFRKALVTHSCSTHVMPRKGDHLALEVIHFDTNLFLLATDGGRGWVPASYTCF